VPGRLFGVKIDVQLKLFRHFLDTNEKVIAEAKSNSSFSEGAQQKAPPSLSL
jgi:hypothetical protein